MSNFRRAGGLPEKIFRNFFANLTADTASMRISVIMSQAGFKVHRLDLGGEK
jgi:hypothetical protein